MHGNGKLVAFHRDCGPAPELRLVQVTSTDLVLEKVDHVTASDGYTLHIEDESGNISTLAKPSTLSNQFSIAWTEFSASENNWIRLQSHAECGDTGYSHAVSFAPRPIGCVEATALANKEFYSSGATFATLQLRGYETCDSGLKFKAMYIPEGESLPVELANNLDNPSVDLNDTGLTAGYGAYSFVGYDPGSGSTGIFFPQAVKGMQNATNGSNALPGTSSTTTTYLHTDHLGSTRLVTNDIGQATKTYKFYPFGLEAPTSGPDESRMKFTGHERDNELGLDYMLARYYGNSLGRFLSVDPASESLRPTDPQSFNRYSYVLNNPVFSIDPTGQVVVVSSAAGSAGAAGTLVDTMNEELAGSGAEVTVGQGGTLAVQSGDPGVPTEQQAAFLAILQGAISNPNTGNISVSDGGTAVVGKLSNGELDIGDVRPFGSDPANGVTRLGTIAHEVSEFFVQQNVPGATNAHEIIGIPAENKVNGTSRQFTPGKEDGRVNKKGNGSLRIRYKTGVKSEAVVKIKVRNFNVVKVKVKH